METLPLLLVDDIEECLAWLKTRFYHPNHTDSYFLFMDAELGFHYIHSEENPSFEIRYGIDEIFAHLVYSFKNDRVEILELIQHLEEI